MIRARTAWSIACSFLLLGLVGCAGGPGGPGRPRQPYQPPPPARTLRTNLPKWNWPWQKAATPVASRAEKTPSSVLNSGGGRSTAKVEPSGAELSRYFPGVERSEPVELARASRWGFLYNRQGNAPQLDLTSTSKGLQTAGLSMKRSGTPSSGRRWPNETGPDAETILPVAIVVPRAPDSSDQTQLASHEIPTPTQARARQGLEEGPADDPGAPVEPPPLEEANESNPPEQADGAPTIPDDEEPALRGRPRLGGVMNTTVPVRTPAGATTPAPAPAPAANRADRRPPAPTPQPVEPAAAPRTSLLRRLFAGRAPVSIGRETGDVLQIR